MSETPETAQGRISIELYFFANFRDAVGQKTLEREYPGDSVRIGTVLDELEDSYEDLELFDAQGELREFISVLKNGRNIIHLDGLETPVESADRIAIFPPVAGG